MDTVSDREPKGEQHEMRTRERERRKVTSEDAYSSTCIPCHFTRRNPNHRPQERRNSVHSFRKPHTRTSDIQLGLGCRRPKVYKAPAFLESDSNGVLHHHKVGLEWSGELVLGALEVGRDGIAET
jgi:hypothetical protein